MAESLRDPKDPSSSIDSVIEQYQSSGIPDKKSANLFAWFSALYLNLLALPLIGFPRFLVILLGPELINSNPGKSRSSDQEIDQSLRALNGLELYLARLAGMSFVTLATILILQTGSIPLTSSLTQGDSRSVTPYRQPTIFFTMTFLGLFGFSSWNVGLRAIGGTASILTAWGLYVFLFASDSTAKKSKKN